MAKITKPSKQKITKEQRRAKYTQKARDKRNKKTNKHMTCFQCRKRGHTVSECPMGANTTGGGGGRQQQQKQQWKSSICYKCGETDHPLKSCPKLTPTEKAMFQPPPTTKHNNDENPKFRSTPKVDYSKMILPHATCFICNQKGHLSSQCQDNDKGVYVSGGSCKICGSKDHLVMHCPVKKERLKDEEEVVPVDGVDVEEFLEGGFEGSSGGEREEEKVIPTKRKRKAVTF